MNEVPETELFSAYVDGELTAEEQARVEQILAASPEARQLLEELRALGSTVQALPQAKLDEDLSAQVLKVAERRMLLPDRAADKMPEEADDKPSAGRAAETLKGSDADSAGWLGIPWREISLRGMFSKRALIWSCVVVVTAVIINFTAPPPPKPNQEVARLEHTPAANPTSVPGENRTTGSAADGSWDVPAGEAKKRLPDDALAKPESPKAAPEKARMAIAEPSGARDMEADRAKDQAVLARPAEHTNEMPESLAMREGPGFEFKAAEARPAAEKFVGKAPEVAPAKADASPTFSVQPSKVAGLSADKKAAEIRVVAANGPAAAPMATELAASPPVASAAPGMALADSAVAPQKAEIVEAAKAPAAPVAVGSSRGGSMPGARKTLTEDADAAHDRVAKAGEAAQLMNGADFAAKGSLSPALSGSVAGSEGNSPSSGTKLAMKMKTGRVASAETVVRLDVSAAAVEQKVFEGLSARCGLQSEQFAAAAPLNAPAPALDSNLRVDQRRGGRGGGGGGGGRGGRGGQARPMARGSAQAAPAESAASGSLDPQQSVSRDESKAVQGPAAQAATDTAGSQVPAAPSTPQRRVAQTEQPKQSDQTTNVQQKSTKTLRFELNVSPEQLASIMTLIGTSSESFSAPKIESGNSSALPANSFAGSNGYTAKSSIGGMGTAAGGGFGGGGTSAAGQRAEQKADAGAPAQPQAAPRTPPAPAPFGPLAQQAARTDGTVAKQHVVFLLNVVDRLPPSAQPPQVPTAAPSPAQQ